MRLTISLGLLLALGLVAVSVDGQFFTKPSKSIPRMGRRSSPDSQSPSALNLYRHIVIDSLVDKYGPSVLNAIVKARAIERARQAGRVETRTGEFVPPEGQESDLVYEQVSRPDSGLSPRESPTEHVDEDGLNSGSWYTTIRGR